MESPETIGKFRILQLVGQGAMGRVFQAEDPLIGRLVAIKVMTAEADGEARERFRNEARTIGQLSHPNIVQVHEFGFHESQPYLVMEYLLGESLDRWLERPRPLEARVSVLLDLCEAIDHAHSRGILHRDVKPSNLQALPEGICKLMDFGIARSETMHLTATGMVVGTPEFMAPEVLQDAGHSTRSDLFAVGLVAYQVFAGVNPFHAKTLQGCLTRVLTFDPPPLSATSTEAPDELSETVSGYLRKTPEERPEDVRPLKAALRRLQDRTVRLEASPRPAAVAEAQPTLPMAAIEDPASGTAETASRPAARRGWPLLLVSAAGLGALGLTTAVLWQPGSEPVASDLVETAQLNEAAPLETGEAPSPSQAGDDSTGESPASQASAIPDRLSPPADPPEQDRAGSEPAAADTTSAVEEHPAELPARISPPSRELREPPSGTGEPEPAAPATPAPEPSGPEPAGNDVSRDPEDEPPASESEAGLVDSARRAPSEPPPSEPGIEEPEGSVSGEPSGPVIEPALAMPEIDRLEPAFIRRGSTTTLQVIGTGFGTAPRVVIHRGGRPADEMRILRSRVEGPSTLLLTLRAGRQLSLGTYRITVVDADGRESAPVSLEVGL